jgi:hypothetical protein
MNGEDESTDSTVMPLDTPAPRAQLVKLPPPAAPGPSFEDYAALSATPTPAPAPAPGAGEDQSTDTTVMPPEVRRALPVDQGAPAQGAPTSDPTRLGALADARARYAQEMSAHPELRGKLMAMTDAEVGDNNDQAKQALIETIFNRAASRNMSLSATLASRYNSKTGTGYWAPSSWNKANAMSTQYIQNNLSATLDPMIDRALSGSNLSNFSTGNQSGNVKSAGAPISFNPNPQQKYGDTFVIENRDAKWAAGMKKTQGAGSGEPEPTPWTSSAPRAQPVVPATQTAQIDTEDTSDPAFHWPEA